MKSGKYKSKSKGRHPRAQQAQSRFAQRAAQKKKRKSAERRELLRELQKTGVPCDGVVLQLSDVEKGHYGERRQYWDGETVGSLSVTTGGLGFLTPEEAIGCTGDVFLPAHALGAALDGDRVRICYRLYRRGSVMSAEGRVREILTERRDTLIGLLIPSERGTTHAPLMLIPDDPHLPRPLPVLSLPDTARTGDRVEARLLRSTAGLSCRITATFGASGTREANYAAILADCGIETDFTPEQLRAAALAAARPLPHRKLRRETILTLDGAGAKDLDDAVSVSRIRGGWRLGVHIADVSAYIDEGGVLDRLAVARGTSIYFADKVVPMLPPSLSNGACSLQAGEPRLTLSAMITLGEDGSIRSLSLEPSIIRSAMRGVYDEVNALFQNEADEGLRLKYRHVLPTLRRMRQLYRILKQYRGSRHPLNIESTEADILLNEEGTPTAILPCARGEAEEMIEHFMLCANEAVATYLHERGLPCVYRIHEPPSEERLCGLAQYAHALGLPQMPRLSHAADDRTQLTRLLRLAEEKGLSRPISYQLLRSLPKAVYSEKQRPHFGLGIECYCHFTSPIRRLSDLFTHRILHRMLEGSELSSYYSHAARVAAAATEGEQRAVAAERRIEALYKALYLADHVGECYAATVSSVGSFGLFAMLDNTCEGMLPLLELSLTLGEQFFYDEGSLALRSQHLCLRVGDHMRVRVEEVDIDRARVRFSLISLAGGCDGTQADDGRSGKKQTKSADRTTKSRTKAESKHQCAADTHVSPAGSVPISRAVSHTSPVRHKRRQEDVPS